MSKTGIVKWFNEEKGFGFISSEGGDDIFVHISNLKGKDSLRSLKEGDTVSFEIKEGEKGPMAIDVLKL